MKGSTRWLVLAVLCGPIACSRPNPDFDDGPAGADSGRPGDSGPTSGTPVTTTAPTSGSVDSSAGVTTLPPDTSGDPVTTADTSNITATVTDGPEPCVPSFGEVFEVHLAPPVDPPGCVGGEPRAIDVIEASSNVAYAARVCLDCPCTKFDDIHEIFFDHPPPVLEVGTCYGLQRDLADSGDVNCFVRAYSLYDEGGTLMQVVSNILAPQVLHPFSFALGDQPVMECGEGCDPPPGRYSLVEQVQPWPPVPPNNMATPFPNGFQVFNRGSGYDEVGCETVARWHATGS